MLNLEPRELENTWRCALESAALLRRCGETAKADRLESLARIAARRLAEAGRPLAASKGASDVACPANFHP